MIYSVLFLIMAVVSIAIGKKIYHDYINPLSMLIGVFFVAFSLFYASDFIYHDLRTNTIWVFISSFLAYILGLYFTQKIRINSVRTQGDTSNGRFEKIVHLQIVQVGWIITIYIIVVSLVVVVKEVGFHEFVQRIIFIREEKYSEISFLYRIAIYLKRVMYVLSAMAINYAIKYKEKKCFCFALALVNIVLLLSYTRQVLIYGVIIDALTIYFSVNRTNQNKKTTKRKILYVLIAGLMVWFFVSSQEKLNKIYEVSGAIAGKEVSQAIVTLVSYFMGTIKSTDIYLSMERPSLPFVATLRWIYEITGVNTSKYLGQEFVNIPFSYNTSTFQYYLYQEAGIVWVILASFLLAVIFSGIYRKTKENECADNLVLRSLLMMWLCLSIRCYMVLYLEFWIPIASICLIHLIMSRARKRDRCIMRGETKWV